LLPELTCPAVANAVQQFEAAVSYPAGPPVIPMQVVEMLARTIGFLPLLIYGEFIMSQLQRLDDIGMQSDAYPHMACSISQLRTSLQV
jgi:hypothetical protein